MSGPGEFNVEMFEVAKVSQRWDEQGGELTSAGRTISSAGTGGFPPAVSGAANGFTSTWAGMADDLAKATDGVADGLRGTVRSYLASDETNSNDIALLGSYRDQGRR